LLRAIEGDKKRKGNSIHIILPTHIGEVEDREVRLSNIGDIFKTI
jgi:3-dehydroquinate synthetase